MIDRYTPVPASTHDENCIIVQGYINGYKEFQSDMIGLQGSPTSGLLDDVTSSVTTNMDSVKTVHDGLAANDLQTNTVTFSNSVID